MWRQFLLILTLLSVHAAKAGHVADMITDFDRKEFRKDLKGVEGRAVCDTPLTKAATKVSLFLGGTRKATIYFEGGNVVFHNDEVCWKLTKARDVEEGKKVLIDILNNNRLVDARFENDVMIPDYDKLELHQKAKSFWESQEDVKLKNFIRNLLREAKSLWKSQDVDLVRNLLPKAKSLWKSQDVDLVRSDGLISFLAPYHGGDSFNFYLMGKKVIMNLSRKETRVVDRVLATKLIDNAVDIQARTRRCEAKFYFSSSEEGNEDVKLASTRFINQLVTNQLESSATLQPQLRGGSLPVSSVKGNNSGRVSSVSPYASTPVFTSPDTDGNNESIASLMAKTLQAPLRGGSSTVSPKQPYSKSLTSALLSAPQSPQLHKKHRRNMHRLLKCCGLCCGIDGSGSASSEAPYAVTPASQSPVCSSPKKCNSMTSAIKPHSKRLASALTVALHKKRHNNTRRPVQ